jgi:hypothetical protein
MVNFTCLTVPSIIERMRDVIHLVNSTLLAGRRGRISDGLCSEGGRTKSFGRHFRENIAGRTRAIR